VNLARLYLLLTAACWATYPVLVKILVQTSGTVLDASLLTVIRFTMNAVIGAFLIPPGLLPWSRGAPGAAAAVDAAALARASAEISAVGIAGTLLNTWGIEHTSAIRAALLLSSINVITPFLSVLIGSSPEDRNVSPQTWLSCGVSFAATAYATLGGEGSAAARGLQLGDLAVLGAACCYAAVKVRLAARARTFQAEALAAGRLLAGAVLSWLVFAAGNALGEEANWQEQVAQLPAAAWGLLLLSSLVPGVLATVLQSKGQRTVPPAQAQTIYAAVPLFAAAYDLAFLQEAIEDREVVAGVAIVAGAVLASRED